MISWRITLREYELIINEAFKNGLSPEHMTPFNTQALWECLGFRCGKMGLEAYVPLENPVPGAIDMSYSWPFPQVITGPAHNFLIIRDSLVGHQDDVYTISDDNETVTFIYSVDELTYGVGTLMEVADFGEYVFMTNGVIMIYWDAITETWLKVITMANIPMMRTVCNFKGQAIGGHILSAWHDCDTTSYVWSKIGEMDFTPTRSNEAGYRNCPYGGVVHHVRRLGNGIVGYSSKGIVLMSPVSKPAATFGFTELSDIGLLNRGAIDGNQNRHVYIGEDFVIREITKEGIKELGYQYYIEEEVFDTDNSKDIIVKYDPMTKDFYIGNDTKTYLLSPYGLTEVQQHPSAVWARPDVSSLGLRHKESFMLPATEDTFTPTIITEVFDMGYKGLKTTSTIETDAMLATEPTATVDWANDLLTWGYGSYIPINNEGIATSVASGNFFRFGLKFTTIYNLFRISYMKIRYKMTDLRGIRGVYAPPLRGQ